jgi:gliding motility-associated-like protein
VDAEACANDPLVQLNGNFGGGAVGCQWSTTGTGFFSNTTDPHATYTLSASDIALGGAQITLTTITDGTCTPTSDLMAIATHGVPNINAGPDQIVCTAGAVQLFANTANAAGGTWVTSGTGTFLDPNALVTLYTPSSADSLSGSVTLTVTTTGTGVCNAASDNVTISFGGGLSASAGGDVVACSTDPNIALNGAVNGTATGVWTTSGTGSFSPSATTLDATYIPGPADFVLANIDLMLATTNNQGCPAGVDTLQVTYNVPPVVNAGQSVVLCNGIQDVQLNALVQHHTSMQWFTTGTGTFAPGNDVPDAVYTPSVNDSIVGGVYLILTAYGVSPCGTTTDSLFIDIGPTRIANADADQFLCATGQAFQLAGSITGVNGGAWSTNGTGTFVPNAQTLNATYIPSSTDLVFPQLQFLLTTTGNQGCPADVDTMTVSLETPASANAGPDVNTCDGMQQVQLSGTFAGATGVQWTTSGTGSFIPNAGVANAIYQPSATDSLMQQAVLVLSTTGAQYCPAAADTMLLLFTNPLTPEFTVSTACEGAATVFTDQSTSSNGTIIAWSWAFSTGVTASGQQVSTTFPSDGQYYASLAVVGQNGCMATVSHAVNVLDAPVAGFTVSGDSLEGQEMSFTDLSTGGTVTWHYDFGDGLGGSLEQNPTYVYPNAGQFIVIQTVTNAAGCSDSDSLLLPITAHDVLPPKLPNAFTPNGDGANDVFYVRGGPFVEIDLKIYNGWGELIFRTTDPNFGWDGTYNGTPEINGVYTYTVKAKTVDGVEHERPGKVTLIR